MSQVNIIQTMKQKNSEKEYIAARVIDWDKSALRNEKDTIEKRIFSGTQRLLSIRKKSNPVSDHSNLTWISPHNIHVAGFVRAFNGKKLFCVFNFSPRPAYLTWFAFKEQSASYK